MDVLGALQSVLKGVGATMGNVALMLVFGAMLGTPGRARAGPRRRSPTRLIDMTGGSTSSSRWRSPGCWSACRCTTTPASSCSSRSCTRCRDHDRAAARVRRAAARVGAVGDAWLLAAASGADVPGASLQRRREPDARRRAHRGGARRAARRTCSRGCVDGPRAMSPPDELRARDADGTRDRCPGWR